MLKLIPLGSKYSNIQQAAPIKGGGHKKSRLFISASGIHLHDNLQANKMHYAVAGKIITKEEALHELKKRWLQKNVVVVLDIPKNDGSKDVEQKFLLINQASFAKRHGYSLWKIHQAAKKSNRHILQALSKNPKSRVHLKENPFVALAETRIREEAVGQKVVEEAISLLTSLSASLSRNKEKIKQAITRYQKLADKITDKTIRNAFKKMLADCITDFKEKKIFKFDDILKKFQKTLQWWPIRGPLEKDPKEMAFRSAVWDLFNQIQSIPGDGEIVLSGYILADGKGDYVHMANLAKKLQKQFPERKIRMVVVSAETHRDKLQLLDETICKTHLDYFADTSVGAPLIDKPLFNEDLTPYIKNAALWISGPIGILGLFDELAQEAHTKGIAFTEYDVNTNFQGTDHFAIMVNLGLGFPTGVFINKPNLGSWKDLQNDRLKNILFKQNELSQNIIDQYVNFREIFMCYQSSFIESTEFFIEAVEFAENHSPNKSVDICLPSRGNVISTQEDLEKHIDKDFFRKKGFASVRWISEKDGQQQDFVIPIQDHGKEFRLINPGALSKKDFKLVMALSAPLVGCTGDHSLTQALSYGKIPSYELSKKRELMSKAYQISSAKFGKRRVNYKIFKN